MIQKSVALLTALSLFAGCLHFHPSPPEKKAEAQVQQGYYDYPTGPIHPVIKVLEEKKKYVVKEITFEFYLPPELIERPVEEMKKEVEEKQKNNDYKGWRDLELEYSIRIDYYEAKGEGKKPGILVSPILGGNMIVGSFARYFASNGMNAIIVHRRKPKYDPQKPMDQVEKYLRKSVMRTRQALDWFLREPGVDAEKLGSFGISYGGIVNTLVAAVEPRIRCHIFAMAGGPLSDLILDSKEKAIRKYVRSAAQEAGYTPERLRVDLAKGIRSDPVALAPRVDRENALMVIALFDRVVGRKYSRNLWRAMGKPEVIYTPLGHYGTILTVPYLRRKALKFYRSRFYPRKKRFFFF